MRSTPIIFAALLVLSASYAIEAADDDLKKGDKVPNKAERATVGEATTLIKRGSPEFLALTKNMNPDVVFKDDDCHLMTASLSSKVDELARLVKAEWPGLNLRVTAAWSEEHSGESTHHEARAVDITVSDKDNNKLGRLGRLAVNAGFGWVFYEDDLHVHASVKK